MLEKPFPYRLYLVIAESTCKGKNFLEIAEQAINGGVDVVQLREKNIPEASFLQKAFQLKAITDKYAVPLIINDNLHVAKQVNASGIHVGNKDIPPTTIRAQWQECGCLGYSIEYLKQLSNEETRAADYLGISPVFSTKTKKDTITEWGLSGIRQIRALTDKPLIAIGNMHQGNVADVIRAGADCIAVVSAICGAENPQKAAYDMKSNIMNAL